MALGRLPFVVTAAADQLGLKSRSGRPVANNIWSRQVQSAATKRAVVALVVASTPRWGCGRWLVQVDRRLAALKVLQRINTTVTRFDRKVARIVGGVASTYR